MPGEPKRVQPSRARPDSDADADADRGDDRGDEEDGGPDRS